MGSLLMCGAYRPVGAAVAWFSSSAQAQALYDEYCAVPDHRRAEIIDGTLHVSPRPASRHANAR